MAPLNKLGSKLLTNAAVGTKCCLSISGLKMKSIRNVYLAAFLLVGVQFFAPVGSLAQGAPITDAYRQLRLLSSSTQAGVSYLSFQEEWRKTLGFVNIALEDSKPSNLTKKLQEIKNIYSDISSLWGCRFSVNHIRLAIDYCLDSGFKERNPEAMSALYDEVARNRSASMDVPTSVIVSVLFSEASSRLRELGELLKKK